MFISSDDDTEKQAYADEARQNYETILLHRAKELRPGITYHVFSLNWIDWFDGSYT